jgi:hypothetical protein
MGRIVPNKRQRAPNIEQTSTEFVKFNGGVDQVTPSIAIPAGAAITAQNYEPGMLGGFKRIDGYEIYSGKPSPSSAIYLYCTVNLSGAVAVGDTITGLTSGATGKVIAMSTGVLIVTKVTGTFSSATESFQVAAVTVGAMTSLPTPRGSPTGYEDAVYMNAAADDYRADIAAPSGSGAIRGVALLRGVLYCFRDNAGGTAGQIYKATSSGWSLITLYSSINFSAGNAYIADGTTVTQVTSGATGVVKRQVLETGSFGSSTATGKLILTSVTGTFNATDVLQVGGVTKATASSLLTAITISPGGKYETTQYNFAGSQDTMRLYGCDGVNKAFEFDGDVYIPITTGMSPDTPSHIITHKKMLHLSFRASLQSSAIGFPFQWTAISGANEIGMGEDISGMLTQPGDVMAIATRNSTNQLQGSSVASFVLASISPEIGAIPYSMQNLGVAYWLDDRGVIQITRSQNYGNFDNATVSRKVQKMIDAIRAVFVTSTVYRNRNQVRFYGSDGTGIIMAVVDGANGQEHHFSSFKYPINVTCAVSGEDANGRDVVFLGASNGKVYQADRGSSFDGEEIEAFVRTSFNHSKSPSFIKRYRKATLEASADNYSTIRIHPDFSYGEPGVSQHLIQNTEIQGSGGVYDVSFYESCYYDSRVVSSPEISIDGTGTNIGFVLYSKSDIDLGHILQGITTHFSPRRLKR